MQSQAKKDAELIDSVRDGNYNRVLKYLGRGARVTQDTVYGGELMRRLRDDPNPNRTDEELINDINIFRALSRKTRDYIHILDRVENIFRDAQRAARATGASTAAIFAAMTNISQGRQRDEDAAIMNALRPWQDQQRAARIAAEEARITELRRTGALYAAVNARTRPEPPWAREGMGQARRDLVTQPTDNAYHVHDETRKFIGKIPRILEVIKRDLANRKEYNDIDTIFEPLYTYIKTNSAFESKAVNSIEVKKANKNNPAEYAPKMISRAEWISDLEKVKKGVLGSTLEKKTQMGLIFDFIIKHKKITECFIAGFIHDCTHAYTNGHLSCYMGIIERTVSTLLDCIKGMNEGVFGEINEIIGVGKTWDSLSEQEKEAYKGEWARFYDSWAKNNKELLKSTAWPDRIEALMTAYAATVPPYVLEGIKKLNPSDNIKDALELDYDYVDPVAAGGRRKTRRYKKSKRTRGR
jgi:hypothetical protein